MKLIYKKIDEKYNRIIDVLKLEFSMSDRLILKLKRANCIFLNSKPAQTWNQINDCDEVQVLIDFEEDISNIIPTKMDLNILYEDDALLVINKPPQIPVHPSASHYLDSLSNGVRYYFNQHNFFKKTRPVNRLDKDTSGIVIFAKNEYVQECLVKQMKSKNFIKEYLAVLDGILDNKSGTISAPISRKENSIIERVVSENGDSAVTHYSVIKEFDNMSLVKFILETGRTHQIRVHCNYIGHPIIGDTLYGKASDLINRQALHAYKVTFIHPIKNKQISITADLPEDILKFTV